MLAESAHMSVLMKLDEFGVDSPSEEERVRMAFLQVAAATRQSSDLGSVSSTQQGLQLSCFLRQRRKVVVVGIAIDAVFRYQVDCEKV